LVERAAVGGSVVSTMSSAVASVPCTGWDPGNRDEELEVAQLASGVVGQLNALSLVAVIKERPSVAVVEGVPEIEVSEAQPKVL
jgi:hypothetical protein